MLIKFTRMHRQWLPGQVADLGAGIADAIVRNRRAIYADVKRPRRKKADKQETAMSQES